MGFMSEYISRKMSAADLEVELLKLIKSYNESRQTYMILYASAIGKPIPDIMLNQDDYYLIHDLLRDVTSQSIDIYLETPGGSAEAAEEIVKCLRSRFNPISFIVSGEAKSAGTIMVLSADEIIMTNTGSLGPIDAQVKIGRSIVSAYDYIEWIDNKRQEVEKSGKMNPFEATMVAQISPGELSGVFHALKYAEDLVVDWLVKYKFQHWSVTESRKIPVSSEMKINRAKEIAQELTNHAKWRTHGRSIKANDLEKIGLKVTHAENDKDLCDLIYRIQTVCRLLFGSTNIYKIFASEKEKVFRNAMPTTDIMKIPKGQLPDIIEFEINCPKCGITYKLYAKFINNPKIDQDLQKKGLTSYPKENKIICNCGHEIDLSGIRNEIEVKIGKKMVL